MPYWPGRKPNVNDRFRSLNLSSVRKSSDEIRREGAELRQHMVALDANRAHAELEAADADRQARKHMLETIHASKRIVASGDKRRRPRGVTKEQRKLVQALKLTRTAKVRKKKSAKKVRKTSHSRAI